MKIYKVNMDVWVKGNSRKEAEANVVGDMDYLMEMDNEYVNVISYLRLTKPVLDIEVTARLIRHELDHALFKGRQSLFTSEEMLGDATKFKNLSDSLDG